MSDFKLARDVDDDIEDAQDTVSSTQAFTKIANADAGGEDGQLRTKRSSVTTDGKEVTELVGDDAIGEEGTQAPPAAVITSPTRSEASPSSSPRLSEAVKEERWKARKKHIFILTSAGRPVFTRWGEETDFAELFGVLQILVSMASSSQMILGGDANARDSLRRVTLGSGQAMYFLTEGELQYVMVTRTRESPASCLRQLRLIHHQLLAVLPTVSSVLQRSPSYDVRRMFNHGDINVMRSLIRRLNNEPGFIFRSLQPLGMPLGVREEVSETLRLCSGGDNHMWTLLLYGSYVVSLVAPEDHTLHADDLLLVINFAQVVCNAQGQVWAPICLPRFNTSGYLWCFAARVEEIVTELRGGVASPPASGNHNNSSLGVAPRVAAGQTPPKLILVQLATNQESFPALRQSASASVQGLTEEGVDQVQQIQQCALTTPLPIDLSVLGPCANDLLFFMFISSSAQLVSSQLPPQLANSKSERKALYRTLLKIRDVAQRSRAKEPVLIYQAANYTLALELSPTGGNVGGATFKKTELYMVFLPCADQQVIPICGAAILKWLKTQETKSFMTKAVHW